MLNVGGGFMDLKSILFTFNAAHSTPHQLVFKLVIIVFEKKDTYDEPPRDVVD